MNGYTIRLATDSDLSKIHSWLEKEDKCWHEQELDFSSEQEYKKKVERPFFCNYPMIEAGQKSGTLTVLVRDSDALPVAFSLGNNNIEIFEVKGDCYRNGFGRCLAQYIIKRAREHDVIGLHSECSSPTSQPFWMKMGYVTVPSPFGGIGSNWVACPLPHKHELPDGPRNSIEIFAEDEEPGGQMQRQFQCEAVRQDGYYTLAIDFVKYLPSPDQKIEIFCNGNRVCFEKNIYLSEFGVERECPWVRLRRLLAG